MLFLIILFVLYNTLFTFSLSRYILFDSFTVIINSSNSRSTLVLSILREVLFCWVFDLNGE